MIKIKFTGAKVFLNKLNKSIDVLENKLPQMIIEEMDKIEIQAKRDVPVDTGSLKDSFFKNVKQGNNKLMIEQGFREFYAAYQDFGTGSKFRKSTYRDYLEYTSKFKGLQPARPELVGRKFLFYPFILGTRMMDRKTKTIVKNLL